MNPAGEQLNMLRYGLLIILILAATGLSELHASAYFINAETGRDSNPGSKDSPWRTFVNINNSRISPGDVINLQRGSTWEETLVIDNLHGGEQKISIRAYPVDSTIDKPLISCADDITDGFWPGLLPNGGFENGEIGQCGSNTPGWDIRTAPGSSCKLGSRNGNKYLEIRNSGPDSIIRTKTFSLGNKGTYGLTARVYLEHGENVELYLYYYRNNNLVQLERGDKGFRWSGHQNHAKKPFLKLATSGWHTIDADFPGSPGKSARLAIRIKGKTKVLLDDITLSNHGQDIWSAALNPDAATPEILILNDKRVPGPGKGKSKDFYWHTRKNETAYIISPPPHPENILIGQRRMGIHLSGSSNINLEDIEILGCEGHHGKSTLQGAAILVTKGSSDNTIRNISISNSDEGIRIEGSPHEKLFHRNNLLEDIRIRNNISKGIVIRSYSIGTSVRNCRIENTGVHPDDSTGQDMLGISIGGSSGEIRDTTISNCHISNTAPEGKGPISAIAAFNTDNTRLSGNTIYRSGKNGIIMANSSNSVIDHNAVSETGISPYTKSGSGIAIIADSAPVDNIDVINNTVANCNNEKRFLGGITLQARPCKTGICNSGSSKAFFPLKNTRVMNNIVYRCKGKYSFGFYAENIDYDTLYSDYNLYYPDRKNDILILYKGGEYAGINNHAKYSEWRSVKEHNRDRRNSKRFLEQHSLQKDPEFLAPNNRNFRLNEKSPARNAGRGSDGTPVNIGAY